MCLLDVSIRGVRVCNLDMDSLISKRRLALLWCCDTLHLFPLAGFEVGDGIGRFGAGELLPRMLGDEVIVRHAGFLGFATNMTDAPEPDTL
jgi:hypothetical protein